MDFGDASLQDEFNATVERLKASDNPLGIAMESFRAMLMSLLATGEILDSEQLEHVLKTLYGKFHGAAAAKPMVAERMEWATRYGWLPWKVAEN